MHPATERYVREVLAAASLARRDEAEVREELSGHLEFLGNHSGLAGEEVYAMIEKEFGSAGEIGGEIARAKGRFLTYLKKQARRLPPALAAAAVLALLLRWQVVQVFEAKGACMEPAVEQGSHLLVNKLAYRMGEPRPGDLVVYDEAGKNIVAQVVSPLADGRLTVAKLKPADSPVEVDAERLIGRVCLVTR